MPETLPIPPCRVLIRTPLSDSCFRKYYNRSCEKSRKDVLSSFDDCSEENSGDSSEEVKYLPLPLVPLLVFNLSCYINSKNWLIKKFGDSSDSGDKKRSKLAALRLWYPLLLEALPGYFFLPLDALCPQGLSDLRSRGLGCQEALSARKFQDIATESMNKCRSTKKPYLRSISISTATLALDCVSAV
ncbi:hypothetical protein ACFX14_021624 [Malus domestica]